MDNVISPHDTNTDSINISQGSDVQEVKKKSRLKILLPIILLLLVVGVIGYGVFEYFRIKPNDVKFTNVTSSSVTVSWNTKSPTSATAMVFQGDTWLPITVLGLGGEKYFDSRDVRVAELEAVEKTAQNIYDSGELQISAKDFELEVEVVDMGQYYTHHVEIVGLDPEAEYSFMVGDRLFYRKVKGNGGEKVVNTLQTPRVVSSPNPTYGTIRDAQGRGDISVTELASVSDAVVYVNFWDEITGERSGVFSGFVNEEGNWYVDVSNALTSQGEYFSSLEVIGMDNIFVELEVDAGSLGRWKKREYSFGVTPMPNTVLNVENSVQDINIPGSLVRVDDDILGSTTISIGQEICELNGLGKWSSGRCNCVAYATLNTSIGVCRCIMGYVQNQAGTSCVLDNSGNNGNDQDDNSNTQTTSVENVTEDDDPINTQIIHEASMNELEAKSWCEDELNCEKGGLLDKCPSTIVGACLRIERTCEVKNPSGETIYDNFDKPKTCYQNLIIDEPEKGRPLAENACVFRGYCGPCVWQYADGGYGGACKCPHDVLTERSCITGEDDVISENLTCSGGYKIGEHAWGGSSCFTCELEKKDFWDSGGGGYYIARWKQKGQEEVKYEDGVCVEVEKEEEDVLYCGNPTLTETIEGDIYISGEQCLFSAKAEGSGKVPGVDKYAWSCLLNEKHVQDCVKDFIPYGSLPPRPSWCDGSDLTEGNTRTGCKYFECVQQWLPEDVREEEACGRDLFCGSDCVWYYDIGWRKPGVSPSCNCGTANGNRIDVPISEALYFSFCEANCKPVPANISFPAPRMTKEWICMPIDDDSLLQSTDCKAIHRSSENPDLLQQVGGEFMIPLEPRQICPYVYAEQKISVCDCPWQNFISPSGVSPGEYCRQVGLKWGLNSTDPEGNRKCKESAESGDVCKIDGTTCIAMGGDSNDLVCKGPKPGVISKNLLDAESSIISSISKEIVKGVFAESLSENKYLVDFETGTFSELLEGIYFLKYQDQVYGLNIRESGDNIQTLLYLDINESGQYDQGVDVLVSDVISEIEIIPIRQTFKYELKEGFNFISLPFVILEEEFRTAAGLLKRLNEVYDDAIFSISKYDKGRWKIVGENSKLYNNDDFQLLPGQGYIIKASKDISIDIVGQPIKYDTLEDTAPIALYEGWNLIGTYGTGVKTYTAKTMIEDMNISSFKAENISKWEKEKQGYNGLVISESVEYGNDFVINPLESVFVRILEGRGNWQPKLATQ